MATSYQDQIQADYQRLQSAADPNALNAYLASTNFTPQQIAEVTGFKSSDLASAMNAARTDGGQGYFSANPNVADDYYKDNKGMTLAEYAVDHWRNNGSKVGQGIVDNGDGSFGLNELDPKRSTYVSPFNDEQLKGIAQTWMTGKGDMMNLVGQMKDYGVSTADVAYALSRYGNEFKPYDGARVENSLQVDNLVSVHGGQGFGGPSAARQAAFREPTPQEMQAINYLRAQSANGVYGGPNTNVPGQIRADFAKDRSYGYVTQAELEQAADMVRSTNHFRGIDPSVKDPYEDPNFRQTLANAANADKAHLRGAFDAGKGKVSPFAVGGSAVGSKNEPGKGWEGNFPGLGQTTTTMMPKQGAISAPVASPPASSVAGPPSPGAAAKPPSAPAPSPAPAQKPFNGIVPTERLAEARRYGLDLNTLTQQELATFVNSGWAGLSQSRQAEWNKQASNRPANPNLMN